ncbi:hypothetical protein OYC64_013779 [Pagothenia borchgrevinki]|uniref:Uncharacterized protein n=1 Tax=Pagothenia borchgrevinki TaxID=8213 RepID=A0ABD2FVD7_PAGBO
MQLHSGTLLPNRRPQSFFNLICSTAILQPDLSLYGSLSPAWQRSSSSAGTRPHNTSKDTQITVQSVGEDVSGGDLTKITKLTLEVKGTQVKLACL